VPFVFKAFLVLACPGWGMEVPMSKRTLAVVLIVLGAVLALVSLAADVLGIGNGSGFGWKQILGSVVGVLLVVELGS
jgi:hypothetical protein